jgi:dihydrofolate synthase / folylpolyglutamate synthase
MDLGLDRMRHACSLLGHPERSFPAFHVGGTNGKGSTSAMLERAMLEKGMRTGLYSSPHLCRWNERIQIGGEPISDAGFEAALGRVFRDAPDDLTFFETLTLAAFVAFAQAGVDAVVLEVGLGGRLDATNVVDSPLACGVTSIAEGIGGRYLEHERLLGDTVPKIAAEKVAIFKRGAPAVVGPLPQEALVVARRAAESVGALLVEVTDEGAGEGAATKTSTALLQVEGDRGTVTLPDGRSVSLAPRLRGRHQLRNAAVSAVMALLGGQPLGLTAADVARGIELASWPGRMETLVHRGASVLLDGAHNVDGVRALVAALPPEHRGGALVFGALADKAFAPMLELLAPHFSTHIYAAPEGRPAASHAELSAVAPGEWAESAAVALDRACSRATHVVVAGSIYLVGAARAHALGLARDPVLGL